MRVTKAQAQANRAHIVETASILFREKGFDGVGVADLMAAAGFTHGGFYKHFASKSDLMAEAAACGLQKTMTMSSSADTAEFIKRYLSREHRDDLKDSCTLAALSGDAARQPESIKTVFAEGIEALVTAFSAEHTATTAKAIHADRAVILSAFAQMIGAIALSRACPDNSALADEILAVSCDTLQTVLQAKNPASA